MKYFNKQFLIFMALIFVLPVYGLNSVQIDVDSIGMANTGVASADTGFAAFLNPASLSFSQSSEMAVSYIGRMDVPDYAVESIGFSSVKPLHFGFIFINEGIKNIVSQQRFVLSLSYIFKNKVSIGINGKIYRLSASGYRETANDPLIQSSMSYQADAGITFVINKHLKAAAAAYDLLFQSSDEVHDMKYKIGLNSAYFDYTMNAEMQIGDDYLSSEKYYKYAVGVKKAVTKNLTFTAGLENFHLSFGVDVNIRSAKYISNIQFQYAYVNSAGPNHCIGMRCKF